MVLIIDIGWPWTRAMSSEVLVTPQSYTASITGSACFLRSNMRASAPSIHAMLTSPFLDGRNSVKLAPPAALLGRADFGDPKNYLRSARECSVLPHIRNGEDQSRFPAWELNTP